MSDEKDLGDALIATGKNILAAVGSFAEAIGLDFDLAIDADTTGPDAGVSPGGEIELPPIDVSRPWVNGWYSRARKLPANPGRVGGYITAFANVDHTTDMHPDHWDALLRSLVNNVGRGNGAHFYLGRTPEQGLVQAVAITRNGNHAGGPTGGYFTSKGGTKRHHPNLVSTGIEVHAGGALRKIGSDWRWGQHSSKTKTWVAAGAPIPAEDVILDPVRPGRGYHRWTEYQIATLQKLHEDLDIALTPAPADLQAHPGGQEAVPKWGVPATARFVGHVSLDPTNRSDPWPDGMERLNAWVRARHG